jgi:hypothetical protein
MLFGAEYVRSFISLRKGRDYQGSAWLCGATATVAVGLSPGVEPVGALSRPGQQRGAGRAALPEQSCRRSTWPVPGLGRALGAIWPLAGKGQPQAATAPSGGLLRATGGLLLVGYPQASVSQLQEESYRSIYRY